MKEIKNNKRRTINLISRGAGFPSKLREKTRRLPTKKEPKQTIIPNSYNRKTRRNSVLSPQKVNSPQGKEVTIVYPSGHIYTGDFNKGKREGTGALTIKDGPIYEGEWKEDKFVPFIKWKKDNKKDNKKDKET